MAVRRTKKPRKLEFEEAEPDLSTDVVEDAELEERELKVWNVIRTLQHARFDTSGADIVQALVSQFALSRSEAKRYWQRYRAAQKDRVAEVVGPNGRDELITASRSMTTRAIRYRLNVEAEEEKARREGKKDFKPSRLTPTYSEIGKLIDLSASLEGHHAPAKKIVVKADVSKEKLELLGVMSPDEIRERIAHGKRLIAARGERRIVETHGEERR